MLPDDYIITSEGYYIIDGITFETLDSYFDYIK